MVEDAHSFDSSKTKGPDAPDSREATERGDSTEQTGDLKERLDADPPILIVCVGASAEGLRAIRRFLGIIPEASGLAFVVVQHLSPDHPTQLPDLIRRESPLPVVLVEEPCPLLSDHIYVAPPSSVLKMEETNLVPMEVESTEHKRIDATFTALAEAVGERGVAVVLSGTGTDGTEGVRAIKEHGGFVLVQQPNSVEYDGMPISALRTGVADGVGDPANLATRLLAYVHASRIAASSGDATTSFGTLADLETAEAQVKEAGAAEETEVKRPPRDRGDPEHGVQPHGLRL